MDAFGFEPPVPLMGILAVPPFNLAVVQPGVYGPRPTGSFGGKLDVKDQKGRNDVLPAGVPTRRALPAARSTSSSRRRRGE